MQCRSDAGHEQGAARSPRGGPQRPGQCVGRPGDDLHDHRGPPVRVRPRPQQMSPGQMPGEDSGRDPKQLRIPRSVAQSKHIPCVRPQLQRSVLSMHKQLLIVILICNYFSEEASEEKRPRNTTNHSLVFVCCSCLCSNSPYANITIRSPAFVQVASTLTWCIDPGLLQIPDLYFHKLENTNE